MSPERWERLQLLFHAASAFPESDRAAFLAGACRDDPTLIPEVQAMLREDARGASLLDQGLARVAGQVLGDSAVAALPFRELGPYRLQRVLGEGGMGVVYLAQRADLGSQAAVKILRDAWLSPARRDRFGAEQRTLAQLNHPTIAGLLDAGALPDGTPWLVMEYVEGVPITEHCAAQASSVVERLRLFRAVCEAVQHAHRHLVIHRDLKPSNILVKRDGTVKLLDFGIAKQLESLDLPVDQTRTGLRFMTPAYAAPEQIAGDRVGIHTDIYSLGVVLYELLVGRLPFDLSDKSAAEVATILLEREPEKPSTAAARLAAFPGGPAHARAVGRAAWTDLDVLCLTAMHKDPARRYRSAEALIRDIDHFLDGEPLEARPDRLGYRVGKFTRRHWRSVSAAAFAFVFVVSLVVYYTVRLTTARNVAVAEAARTLRIQRFMMNLFAGGDEAAGPADRLLVVTLLERGVQEAQSLGSEPAVQAELYHTLGGIYQQLGSLDRADSLLQAGLARRRALLGAEHPDVAASLVAVGLLRVDQARLEEGERLIREGRAMAQRLLPPDHPEVARATEALGRALEERGEYTEALALLEEAVRLHAARGGETAELASSLYELANVHFYAGHYAASDSINRRVLAIHRELFGDRHPHVADDLINLGAIQHDLGHYSEAETYYRQALVITEGWFGRSHHKTASNLTMLGRSLLFQGRFDEAEALLRQALAIQEQVFGSVHPRVASALNELGSVAYQRDRYDQAATHYRRVLEIYRAVYGERHYLIGIALANLASALMAQQQFGMAERHFREALAVYRLTLEAEHQNVGITRIKLGRALLRQQRYAEAVRETRAGYDILVRQSAPAISFLRAARLDLATAHEALQEPALAARFRAELADTSAAGPAGR